MRSLRRTQKILTALSILSSAFLGACEKKAPPPPPPVATPQPQAGRSLALPRFQGMSLNGQPVETIAAAFQDPQTLETEDLRKYFGIQDAAYLDQVMVLIESQLQSGSPMKWVGVYFGGAPKALASHCVKNSSDGICLVEPYAFNCAEALPQKNWTEENYLKLCRRLGRLKAYKADRLVALISGEGSLGFHESASTPPPAPDKKTPEKKSAKSKTPPAPTPAPSAEKTGGLQSFPEIVDLLQYLQREGFLVGLLSDQDVGATQASLQTLGISLPSERIVGGDAAPGNPSEKRLLQALRLARRYVESKNRQTSKAEDQIGLEDLRTVLILGDDFAPSGGGGMGDGINFLENLSTVPGGADLIFIHLHNLEADQKLTRRKSALENYQFFLAQERLLHPLRLGAFLEQAAVGEMRAPGGKGGFLNQTPSAPAESFPTESRPSESQPSLAESRPSATPGPMAPKTPESKPSGLLSIPPAPPPDPRKDAL
ncbi:MAG: hypothetical protein K8R69_09670 [Deltaproteobacteria bacterium]|nr:hypothetical protein [Deltaproteobacteria bacterium]